MIKCNNCGTDNLDIAIFCKECGTKLSVSNENINIIENDIKCCKCNTINPKDSAFCKECGVKFSKEEVQNISFNNNEENTNNNNKKIDYKLLMLIILGLFGIVIIVCLAFGTNKGKDNNIDNKEVEGIQDPEEEITEEHIHEFILEPISATKHKIVCNIEGCDYYEEKECTFVDDVCECGNKVEEKEEVIEEKDDKQELLDKISGVWSNCDYFLNFDGGDGFYHGWFYSDLLPYNHITNCKKIDENIYEVELFEEAVAADEEYEGSDIYTWNAVFDGSYDDFKSLLKIVNDIGEEHYYLYISDSIENATDDYDFDDKYSSKYKQKMKEYYESEGAVLDDETICGLARAYYKKMNGEAPPLVSIDSRDGDEITIHLYEIMEYEDYPEENHAATWGWYYINAYTLEGTDFFGMPVNLNEVK